MNRSRVLVFVLVLAVLLGGAVAQSAQANTLTVTNTNDSGPGSLRQAISDAVGGDKILVPTGTYKLASPLAIVKSLTLVGSGARSTVLDGGGATRMFTLQAPAAQVTIVQMMMRNGKSPSGGAINSQVPMTLRDDAIVGNTASTGSGGGVFTSSAFTIDRVLIAGNAAPNGDGGGVEFAPSSPYIGTISDSTLTQNSAGGAGGGLNDYNTSTETVHLEGDSFVANSAAGTRGGGNFRAYTGTQIDFHNTLFAQGSAPVGPNCAYGGGAVVTSDGYNAQDLNDPLCRMTAPTDRNAVNPQLGLLQNNGGPTDSLRPALGSPLIGGGDPSSCPGTDQRGVPRPQVGRCDIGAVERTTPWAGAPVATAITRSGATFVATTYPQFLGGVYSFRYGPTAFYGATTPISGLLGGVGSEPVSTTLSGLEPGTVYHVQLVVTTVDGTATSPDVTIVTSGSQPPVISGARMSHRRFRVASQATVISASASRKRTPRGTEFQFLLSQPATVRIAITGKVSGLRRGRRCVAASAALRRHHARRCTMTARPRPLTRAKVPIGSIGIPFSGRIGSRALVPGTYRATLTARGAGGSSDPVTLSFTVVR
jgi:hypothetical protein